MKRGLVVIHEPAFDGREMELLLQGLADYGSRNGLSKRQLAARLGIPYSTLKGWLFEGDKASKPSKANIERVRSFLRIAEAEHRIEIIRGLLLAVEDQLRWFRDIQNTHGRDVFRQGLNPYDVGYVTSLLIMLSEEEKFRRWMEFNTYSFREFKAR